MNEQLQRVFESFDESAVTTLLDRFRMIIDYETSESRRWKELEELTGITTHSWQKAYLGKQRPTADMLEAMAQHWPKYAFWLITGITDLEAQHICPPKAHPWPSAPEELEEVENVSRLAWQPLIELKGKIRRFLSDEPIPPMETRELEEKIQALGMRLAVDDAYRRTVIKDSLKGREQSGS